MTPSLERRLIFRERLFWMMQCWANRQNPPASMEDAHGYLKRILPLIQTRIKLLSDVPDQVDFFFLEFAQNEISE